MRDGPDVSVGWSAVANHYGVDQKALGQRSRNIEIDSVAARLAKRHAATTLGELALWLGWARARSFGNLTRRADESFTKSKALRGTIQEIERRLAGGRLGQPKPPPRKKQNRSAPVPFGCQEKNGETAFAFSPQTPCLSPVMYW